jgi:hypothetical protein
MMNTPARTRRPVYRALGRAAFAAATLTLIAGTAACSGGSAGSAESAPPATIDTPSNGGPAKVTLTEDAIKRIDLHTTAVRHERVSVAGHASSHLVVPYAAVIYDGDGVSWAYAEVAPRVFVRAPITVAAVQGGTAVLSKGPADGTVVVTVGAPLLLGAEAQIAGEE